MIGENGAYRTVLRRAMRRCVAACGTAAASPRHARMTAHLRQPPEQAHAELLLGEDLPHRVRGGVDGDGVLPAAHPGQPGRDRGPAGRDRAPAADGPAPVPLRPFDVRPGLPAGPGAVAGLQGHPGFPDHGGAGRRWLAACQAGAGGGAAGVFHLARAAAEGRGQGQGAAVVARAALDQRDPAAGVHSDRVAGAGQAVLRSRYP
ncbi:hypothetical protein G6F31_016558 [Rhizopus arrhizus]|nr:hypothetical protein G6F31_016558 [Rhizopus arrhizus]